VHKMERISRSLWIITKHTNQTTRLSQLISPDYLAPSLQQDPTEVINFIRGYVIWCTRTWFPFKESKCKLGVVHSIHFTLPDFINTKKYDDMFEPFSFGIL
jgi:hypothetical protein